MKLVNMQNSLVNMFTYETNKQDIVKKQSDVKIEEHSSKTKLWHYQCNKLFSRKGIILNILEHIMV